MTKVAIMQPTYLPWSGYFALMNYVDIFVVLDNVQFSRRSWQQRNQIKTPNGGLFLTVPVYSKGNRNQLIKDVKFDSGLPFISDHIKSIHHNYSKASFFKSFSPKIFESMSIETDSLFVLNHNIASAIRGILDIQTKIVIASNLSGVGSQADLLASLCSDLGATEYISPPGSQVYLTQSTAFDSYNIAVKYINYIHPNHAQLHGKFLPYMSIIDMIFNIGDESSGLINSSTHIS